MLEAVNDFILEFSDIEQDILYRGWQNRMALPTETEYCLYYISSTKRIGTNIQSYTQVIEDETLDIETLREYVVSIDINDTDNERACNRASILESVARSSKGVKFFKERDVGLLFADDIRYLPFTDENNQYLNRFIVDIHLTVWGNATVPQDYATEVSIDKFVNVDQYLRGYVPPNLKK